MRQIGFVARMEITHQMRRRETQLWIFVMPLIFFYFIGTVSGGSPVTGGERDRIVLDSPAEGGFLVDQLVARLEAQNFEVVRDVPPEDVDNFSGRLVVPTPSDGRSFTDALLAGDPQTVRVHTRSEGQSADFERLRIQRAVYTLVADLALADERDDSPTPNTLSETEFVAVQNAPRLVTVDVSSAGRRLELPSGFEQTIPGTMVMFTMLILLTGGATQLVIEREQGLLRRLASTPITRRQLVAGKWFGKLLLGLVQIVVAMVAGTVLFDMTWGTSLPAILVVLFSWAAFNASLGLLLGNVANTPAQMSGLGVLTTMVLAALGGCWWPIEVAPLWAQRIALTLPTGWAMDAMHRLISFGDPASIVLPHVAALVAGAIVLGAASARMFRYQ